MSTPVFPASRREKPRFCHESSRPNHLNYICNSRFCCNTRKKASLAVDAGDFHKFKRRGVRPIRAGSADMAFAEADIGTDALYTETFELQRTQTLFSIRNDCLHGQRAPRDSSNPENFVEVFEKFRTRGIKSLFLVFRGQFAALVICLSEYLEMVSVVSTECEDGEKHRRVVEGKISVRLDPWEGVENWQLTIGCNLPGKWVLHWGVTYFGDNGSEWDQPPPAMQPPGSIAIKDYAIETPLKKMSSSEGYLFYELQITLNSESEIAAVNFVLKEEDTGAWYQNKGRDFRVPLIDQQEDEGITGGKKSFRIWSGCIDILILFKYQEGHASVDLGTSYVAVFLGPKSSGLDSSVLGAFDQISNMLLKPEGSRPKGEENDGDFKDTLQQRRRNAGFYEEYPIFKEEPAQNFVTVSVGSSDGNKRVVHFETDLPGDVIVHWGVCRDKKKKWEIPAAPHPPETKIFRKKALRTLLQTFVIRFLGMLFVLKLNEYTWINNKGSDFYIPLIKGIEIQNEQTSGVLADESILEGGGSTLNVAQEKNADADANQANAPAIYTGAIIDEIRNLASDISSKNRKKTKNIKLQEKILQEIEKLAAEAYSIFRSSSTSFVEPVTEEDTLEPPVKISSATGSGFEVLCQGFNWESHKSGRWYSQLNEKATELASIGFTIIWLPPPTASVSPEGYMPTDLYNLNSRYGNMEELKILVKKFHKAGVKVLGDAVLNHRCAQYKNQNGVWNIYGGRLNWDDRAVVCDDPHFQKTGLIVALWEGSSSFRNCIGPNQIREEIGYDGWRLDFVRGFWGGYVKDYLDASEPFFAVGEYWDSLSYTYGVMDDNQDAHRQRIIDWINATNGTAGAFDVTTKGILHSALERCEYWRLSDQKGKPPGVVGWWPSRAVTFIENHDTGSTQGHWRFPSGKEMQGYAYILTHPGTPAVFYDHIFSHYQHEISELIKFRHRNNIHCRSTVKILKAERDVYTANIDEKVIVKIGPGHYEPPSTHNWVLALEGRDYKVWEASLK
ncbi:hypothetical protein ACLOJK_032693 [Asimina triloba]